MGHDCPIRWVMWLALRHRVVNIMLKGLLNTDWGDNGHRNFLGASLHSFAHGAANAWNGKAVDNDRFTDNFCHQAFGQQNNRLAKALRLLGSTYITCGKTVPNKSLLFMSFFEPMRGDKAVETAQLIR